MVGRWLARRLSGGLGRVLGRANVDSTLSGFLGNIVVDAWNQGLLPEYEFCAALDRDPQTTSALAAKASGATVNGRNSNTASSSSNSTSRPPFANMKDAVLPPWPRPRKP